MKADQDNTPPPVQVDAERAERIKLEAYALRHVFNLGADERHEAASQLSNAALELVQLLQDVADTLQAVPNVPLADLAEGLERRRLRDTRETLEAVGVLGIVAGTESLSPSLAKTAYKKALEDTRSLQEGRRIQDAIKRLERAKGEPAGRRLDTVREAVDALALAEREHEQPLEEIWVAHVGKLNKAESYEPHEAVMLDAHARGRWADWFNRHLSGRGGLTAGRTLLLGGAPMGGKTSLAAAFAVDALAAGLPVCFWQLELGIEETLEHLIAQDPDRKPKGSPFYAAPFNERLDDPLPEQWSELLTIPRWPSPTAEGAITALERLAAKCRKLRRAGKLDHVANGLFIIDYCQLLTMADNATFRAGHEVITTAVSRLAKATAEAGAVLILLSQVTKDSRKEGQTTDGTEFSGADIARPAHVAATVAFGHYPEEGGEIEKARGGKPCEYVPNLGSPRIIAFSKTRGVQAYKTGYPASSRGVWYNHRALWGGTGDEYKAEQGALDLARQRMQSNAPRQAKEPF